MLFTYKKNTNYKIKSIVTSKFNIRKMQQFNFLNCFFIVKNKTQDQVLFLFIILYLLNGKAPKIIKKKGRQKSKFLGFSVFFSIQFIYQFIIMYLSILDTIILIETKSNICENRLVFKDFPIIYEIDCLCEQYNPVLDYIKNYKFILNTKFQKNIEFN
jgi:hypothetical protein